MILNFKFQELQKLLKDEGFSLEVGVANIPTAFVATYKNGEGPVIGILGEYDALPGLSQTTEPKKNLRDGVSSGHACGHNLFGVASVASSIAVKKWMEKTNTKGTIKFFGCPAEEGGSGKVYMVREGYFENVDIVLNWHPSNSNGASAGSSLANKTGKFRFSGVSAHAAGEENENFLIFRLSGRVVRLEGQLVRWTPSLLFANLKHALDGSTENIQES